MAKFIHQQFNGRDGFKQECIVGSVIAPEFWGAALNVVPEQEIDPLTHEVIRTPIHDALGWKYTRFVRQLEKPLEAGVFQQASGQPWQLKLSRARIDRKKQKPVKYETPRGTGSRAYLPPVPISIQEKILENRFSNVVEPSNTADFWIDCVAHIPDLPIILTEGGKKGLCALSHGYAAIALTGVNGGYFRVNKNDSNDKEIALSPDLETFMTAGRRVVLAFDQDAKSKTRRTVARAQYRLAELLKIRGCQVSVATWNPADGKGLDDLVVQCGPEALDRAIANAQPIESWKRSQQLESQRERLRNNLGRFAKHNRGLLELKLSDLAGAGHMLVSQLPKTGILVIKAPTGTGKTNLSRLLLAACEKVIGPGSRESLQRGLGFRLGLDYLNDLQRLQGGWLKSDGSGWATRLAMCMDSIAKIDFQNFQPGTYDLFLDEADQALFHALLGGTCGKDGKRPKVQAVLTALVKDARRVILASAGVSEKEIALVSEIRGDERPYVLHNDHQGGGYPCELYTDSPEGGDRRIARAAVQGRLIADLRSGKRIIVHSDTKTTCYLVEAIGLRLGLKPEEILRFDGDTSCEARQRQFADAPNAFLDAQGIQLLVASPSLTSGVSITGDYFDRVYGFFEGQSILPSDGMQSLARYRRPVPRIVFVAARGRGKALEPINALDYNDKAIRRSQYSLRPLGEKNLNLDINTPTSRYVAARQAADHWEMVNFGVSLQAHLQNEGHRVTVMPLLDKDELEGTVEFIKGVAECVRERQLEDQVNAAVISPEKAEKLRSQKALTYDQRLELDRFEACQFYGIEGNEWTREFVEMDNGGEYRQGLRLLAEQILPGVALGKDEKAIARLQSWNEAIALHDLPCGEARRQVIQGAGILDALAEGIRRSETLGESGKPLGWSDESQWLKDLHQKCLPYAADIKLILGVRITIAQTPCQFFGMLIRHLTKGVLKTKSRSQGARGEQVRVYSFTLESLGKAREFFSRLVERWLVSHSETSYAHYLSQYLLLECVYTRLVDEKKKQANDSLSRSSPSFVKRILPKELELDSARFCRKNII